MEITLCLSARKIVLHIVISDLKIFRHYCYTLFLYSFSYNDAYSLRTDYRFFTVWFCITQPFILQHVAGFRLLVLQSQPSSYSKTFFASGREFGPFCECSKPRNNGNLKGRSKVHWPTSSARRVNCHVCSARGKRRSIVKKCDVGLCIFECFEQYHTKARFN
jgi:hypothetical protein